MSYIKIFFVNLLLLKVVYCKFENYQKNEYNPTWESLDKRPLPSWYDEAKIGIFLHWGVYAVPALGEWFWAQWKGKDPNCLKYMEDNYPPNFTYQDFAKDFKAEFYNPNDWADLFKKSGAKYVVLTSKHHDGFCMWPSTYTFSWNCKAVGPNRDLLGDLAGAIRNKTDLKFGLYYSLFEWYNPMYQEDKKLSFSSDKYVENKMLPEMYELVQNYEPEIFWADGDWEADDEYFKSKEFLAWLYNESPVKDTIVVNDRWGKGDPCHHGGYFTCSDRFDPGILQTHKFESAMTLDKVSWGYRQNAKIQDFLTDSELITFVTRTVSCGGNILINVGPTKEGWIAPVFQERLLNLGKWLSVNGEAIYGTKPWIHQNDTIGNTWYTNKDNKVYAIALEWPKLNNLKLKLCRTLFNNLTKVNLLGFKEILKWKNHEDQIEITLPDRSIFDGQWAWVIKIIN